MRIATHIKLFLIFIFTLLIVNAYIGVQQIDRVSENLRLVVDENFDLLKHINVILQNHGEKAVLMERALRISEEVNFQDIPASRRTYLSGHVKVLKKGLDAVNDRIAGALHRIDVILKRYTEDQRFKDNTVYAEAYERLKEIVKTYERHNNLMYQILNAIANQNYELTLEDSEKIERVEQNLSSDLKNLHGEIEAISQKAIVVSKMERELAVRVFYISIAVSFICSVVLAIFIMTRVSRPLNKLSAAARKIGQNHFDIKLDAQGNDEVSEVADAFNVMTKQLAETNVKLKAQSEILQKNLNITEEQKKDLEKVNAELDRFVYTVTHDIGAPLMGIAWYGNYLQKNFLDKADAKGRDAINGVVASANRLNTLVNDLLALTRLSRIKNPFEKVSVAEIVDGVCERLNFQIKQAKTTVDIDPALPTIVCDRIKIAEVFYNLISNAIKFSQKSEHPQVTVGYSHKDGMYEFFVADNGIGIDQKYHSDIFGIFRRLHTYTEYQGSGAGLTIVKTIINDHGGNVWIDSREGKGAKFVFSIPDNLNS